METSVVAMMTDFEGIINMNPLAVSGQRRHPTVTKMEPAVCTPPGSFSHKVAENANKTHRGGGGRYVKLFQWRW
ncbi:unnamed protein product [Cuscuta campestris]|uniref:Uncharacterized protein n=1 Tax=Cuscuta campestris TaxID=132261 RepID=A0A484MMZ1_9ASTE|nr:unnamed protein product [Cuscuta campestris]